MKISGKIRLVAVVCTMMVLLFAAGVTAATNGGEIEAVKLIGAWVNAGAPESEPFTFTAKDGKEYAATFQDDVLPLFTKNDAWGPGTMSCVSCHHSVSESSAHELDMGSYEGIMLGADSISNPEAPAKIVIPGDWDSSKLKGRLRNNRMPPTMPFDPTEANRDGPVVKSHSGGEIEAVKLVGAWANAGAAEIESFKFTGKDGKEYAATFQDDVLPLFTKNDAWGPGTMSCVSCHHSVSESSAHELDMGSYEGIMLGADSISNPEAPAKIVIPGDWDSSKLKGRLRNNRMPPTMPFDPTEANRDGPVLLVGQPLSPDSGEPVKETAAPGADEAAAEAAGGGSKTIIGIVLALVAIIIVVVAARSRSK